MQYVILQSCLSSCQCDSQTTLVLIPSIFFSLFPHFSFLLLVAFVFFSVLFPHHPLFTSLQSLSAPQAQALSCVESLCCYQHGQSGCSRLARFLEQMTGQCQASANHCHTSSRSNRWGGRRRQQTMILKPDEPSPHHGFKNLGCSPDCYSP